MAACEPKQNNCTKAGVGPGCFSGSQPGVDGGKKLCLDQVKHDCEEKLKKCIDKECIEQNVKKYEREAKARADQRAERLKAIHDALEKCLEENQEYAYQDQVFRFWQDRYTLVCFVAIARGWNSQMPPECKVTDAKREQQIIDKFTKGGGEIEGTYSYEKPQDPNKKRPGGGPLIDKDGNWIGGVIDIDTGSEKISNEDLFKYYGYDEKGKRKENKPATRDRLLNKLGNIARSSIGDPDYGLGKNPTEANSALKGLNGKITEAKKAMDKACPTPPTLDPFDEWEEQRSYNQKIARCIGACHYQAVSDCKTSQCYCGSYKCDIGKIGGRDGDGGGGSDFPTIEGDGSEIDPRSIQFTASGYEIPIELMYTRSYFPGNILWVSPTTEIRTSTFTTQFVEGTSSADQGHYVKTETLTIDTYISFLVGICAGPVDAIQRVWLDGSLIYDISSGSKLTVDGQDKMEIHFRDGSENASPVEQMEEIEGFGRVPAERGVVTVLIKDLNLKLLTKFPDLKFEVVKVASPDRPQLASSAQPDVDVSQIWRIDTAPNKIFVGTDTGMRVIDYATLTTVREVDVANAADVTPLPYVITVDGTTIGTTEIVYGEERSTATVDISFDKMFQTRIVDTNNTGWDTLVLSNSSGDIYFYVFADTKSSEFSPSDWQYQGLDFYAGFDGMLSGSLQAFTNALFLHNQEGTSEEIMSKFFFGFRGEGSTVEIAGFTQYTTSELNHDFLDGGEGFVMPPIDVAGTNVQVLGAFPCMRDRTVILFMSIDGGYVIMKYRPFTGVIWSTTTTALPSWDGYQIGRVTNNRYVYWLASSNVYKLDMDAGVVLPVEVGTIPSLGSDQRQYYDSNIGAITYFAADDTLCRVFVGRVTYEVQTLTDVVRDVAARAGFDVGYLSLSNVDDVPIKGYRSGTAITARQVLEPLFEVYPVSSYIDLDFNVVSKGASATVEVDPDDLLNPFVHTRSLEAYDTRSASLSYFSIEIDGERATQVFTLPDDFLDGKESITADYTVLENDDYMKSLAELKVFTAQENDSEASISLPPRYLVVTPSDQLGFNGKWRAVETTLGANLQVNVKLSLDANNKYNELLPLVGQRGFGNLFQAPAYRPISFPLMWAGRCTLPDFALSGCVTIAPQKLINDFKNPTALGISPDDDVPAVSGRGIDFAQPAYYGYLVTPPANDTTAWTTQKNNTMVVKFVAPPLTLVDERSNSNFIYYNPITSMLFVGREHIQFRTFEVDIDNVTVTFTGLARARDNTEYFMDHEVGELVMLYDPDYMLKVEVPITDYPIVKGASVNAYGEMRRSDKSALDPDLSAPLAVCRTRRHDTGPAVASMTYPDAKDINILVSQPVQNIAPLGDRFTAYYDGISVTPTFNYCPDCVLEADLAPAVYFLRGEYDEATFDTWLLSGVLDSYVMMVEAPLLGVVTFDALEQENAAFDMTLETLTIVTISNSTLVTGTKASRRVVKWTPGDYTFRPTRGIVRH